MAFNIWAGNAGPITYGNITGILTNKARELLAERLGYPPTGVSPFGARGLPVLVDASLLRMAKFELFLRRWKEANAIDAFAIQCWTSLQQNWGCNVCTCMSMMSEALLPSACEVDVTGVVRRTIATSAAASARSRSCVRSRCEFRRRRSFA